MFAAAVWSLPALALAAEPEAAPPPAPRTDEASLKAWADRHLDQDGWIYYGFSTGANSAVVWLVSERSAGGSKYPLLQEWVRSEVATSPGSRLSRTELDCAKRQFRSLEETFYQGNNLRGPITRTAATPDAVWAPISKGSVGESLLERVCRDAG